MNISMTGIDYNRAPLEQRERFALTKGAQATLLAEIKNSAGVAGCVLISTCNRTELWVSFEHPPEPRPFDLLCRALKVDGRDYERYFTQRDGGDAVRHLFELACGLKSMIFGEDQILSQVKDAIRFSRECRASDPALETAFRRAVTAAKRAKTDVLLTGVDRSAAGAAVHRIKEAYGSLKDLGCLVIGSGEIGRLAARELVREGCDVAVTLRRHPGDAVIPAGCRAVDYEDRYDALRSSKVVISATRSPHYTLMYDKVKSSLGGGDKLLFDLAVPRDIEPSVAGLPGVTLYDIDALGGNLSTAEDNENVSRVRAIIAEEIGDLERWDRTRALLPKIGAILAGALADLEERLQNSLRQVQLDDGSRKLIGEAAGKAVSKVVENILLSLQENTDAETLDDSLSRLSVATEQEDVTPAAALPPRFPLFVDLTGKKAAVIGAGPIALRRIKTLLSFPCSLTVIAPAAMEEIERLSRDNKLTLLRKEYEASDIEGAYLVLAATDDRALNHQIALDAGKNGQSCSIADCREECSFFFPATVLYDGGVIGICGTGENHVRTKTIASDIRRLLEAKEQP